MENEELNGMFITIPVQVIKDDSICANAKLLFGVILSLTHNKDKICYASDDYFVKLFNVADKTPIQRWLKELETSGYIERRLIYKADSKQIDKRFIQVKIQIGSMKKTNTPICKNTVDNKKINKQKNITFITENVQNFEESTEEPVSGKPKRYEF